MAGIYVHVPFCNSFCIYCDFFSEIRPKGYESYKDALIREVALQKEYFKGVPPETLYFGGGTPSLLPVSVFREIVQEIKTAFGVNSFKEFTIEVNPDDIVSRCGKSSSEDKLSEYLEIGVNRISMGVQSFNDEHLKWMNRRHSAKQAVSAYQAIRDAGFSNVSLDLIFGYHLLDDRSWDDNISKIIDLGPEHVSCYQMSIEPESALGKLHLQGGYIEPTEEQCAGQYSTLQNRLFEAGYCQYEISNFAKPGFESKHNSNYWARAPYLGLGPAAHSFDGKNQRFWNVADIDLWSSDPTASRQSELLNEDDIFNEQIMLGLRRCKGVNTVELDQSRLAKIKPAISSELKAGNISFVDNYLSIPKDKLFISDSIMSELFL